MTMRDRAHRWFSPSLFALLALSFLLPFATVSCDSASTTFSGVQLVTHTVPRGGVLHEGPDCSTDISVCVERDAAPTATVALVAALVALLLGLLGFVRGPGWCAAVSFGALLVLPFEGPFLGPDVGMHYGWVLALISSGVAGCVYIRRAWRRFRPGSVRRGPRRVHLRALGIYGLIVLVASIAATASDSILQVIGGATIDWFVFVVVPAWLVVAALLGRWQKQGRTQVVERTRRWDLMLWLGPFLGVGLCSRRLRRFLLPPRADSPQSGDRRVAAV